MATIHTNSRQQREQVFMALYKSAFPWIARYVSKMGGSFDEARDVFQDALVIYYEKQLAPGLKPLCSDKAYLLGIAKHLWIKRYHAGASNIPLDDLHEKQFAETGETTYASQRLMHYLATAGQKCMELLRAFYYDRLPVAEAFKQFGYSGIRSVTVQKYKCLEKVRETIKQKALTYEDFLE